MLTRLIIASLLATGAFVSSSGASQAFWKRSHWGACNEAPNEAERIRLNCWIFDPVPDFPPLGVIGFGAYGVSPYPKRPPSPGPTVRRLG